MALEGTLRDFSFADILQLISLQRKADQKNGTGVRPERPPQPVLRGSLVLDRAGCDRPAVLLPEPGERRQGLTATNSIGELGTSIRITR